MLYRAHGEDSNTLMIRSFGLACLCAIWMQHPNHLLFGWFWSGTSWDNFREFDLSFVQIRSTTSVLVFLVVHARPRANHCAGGSPWMSHWSYAFNVGAFLSSLSRDMAI